jgi:hypothetical protein
MKGVFQMIVYTTNGRLDLLGKPYITKIMNEDCRVVEIKPNIYIREENNILYVDKIFSLERLSEKLIIKLELQKQVDDGIIVKKIILPKPIKK